MENTKVTFSSNSSMTATVSNCSKIWLSQREATKYLGVSKDWLIERRLDGTLHYSKVGNTIFYIKKEVDNLIKRGAVTGVNHFREATTRT